MNTEINKILKILKNKYIITLAVFLVFILFFDRNNFFVQMDRRHDLKELEAHKEFYLKEIDSTKKALNELKSDPHVIQNYARENLYMSKDSEDVFVIDRALDSLSESRKK